MSVTPDEVIPPDGSFWITVAIDSGMGTSSTIEMRVSEEEYVGIQRVADRINATADAHLEHVLPSISVERQPGEVQR